MLGVVDGRSLVEMAVRSMPLNSQYWVASSWVGVSDNKRATSTLERWNRRLEQCIPPSPQLINHPARERVNNGQIYIHSSQR
jgi:hypothetical protein